MQAVHNGTDEYDRPRAPQARPPSSPDLLLVLFLIGLDVAARLLLHTWNVSPVAASALFAGLVLRRRWLALLVPLAAMPLSDLLIGFDDWRIMSVVYASLALPAVAGILGRRYGASRVVVPAALSCSLMFFADDELRGLGVQRHLQPRQRRADPVLRRGLAVPQIHGRLRPVVGRGPVRRRLAGAAPDSGANAPSSPCDGRFRRRTRASSRRNTRRLLITILSHHVRGTGSGSASCRPTVTTRSSVTVCATSFTGPSGIASFGAAGA